MFCSSCHAQLEPRMSFCPACGANTPFAPAQTRSPHVTATAQSGSSSIETVTSVQTQQLDHPEQAREAQQLQQQQRPRQQPGLSRSKATLLAALALVAMLSGFSLILYSAIIHPAQLHSQATATALAVFNAQASQTARANAQASATAIANDNATATAQALATAQAVATATALQNIYTQSTRGMPIFNDPLTYNANNWTVAAANGGGGCSFTGGVYHSAVQQKGYYLPCIAQNTSFSNFAFQVTLTILKGDEGGIIFRADNVNSKGYLFSIKNDGSFTIFLTSDNSHSTNLDFGPSPAIHTGLNKSNMLTVVARGSQLYLYINRQYVTSVTDHTYTSGQIGVFSADDSAPTDVAFTNAQVWRL
jgi:hypothetical protein